MRQSKWSCGQVAEPLLQRFLTRAGHHLRSSFVSANVAKVTTVLSGCGWDTLPRLSVLAGRSRTNASSSIQCLLSLRQALRSAAKRAFQAFFHHPVAEAAQLLDLATCIVATATRDTKICSIIARSKMESKPIPRSAVSPPAWPTGLPWLRPASATEAGAEKPPLFKNGLPYITCACQAPAKASTSRLCIFQVQLFTQLHGHGHMASS